MAIMLAKTCQALKAAGAPKADAIAAVEELAAYENRLTSVENGLVDVEGPTYPHRKSARPHRKPGWCDRDKRSGISR
jgi:hypothetical protein